jgi:hypothetical protein
MLGAVSSGLRGMLWLATQRPIFTIVYGLMCYAVFSLIGTAVCRIAALHFGRKELIGVGRALTFAKEKVVASLLVLGVPAAVVIGIAVIMFLGSVLAAIPALGELLGGLLYVLAIMGGFAIGIVVIATLLGFNLMWPTIAVEGSDSFDAVSRGYGYIGQRCSFAVFYNVVLFAYAGLCFIMVRLIALVTLKITHDVTASGMSLFGSVASSETSTFSKLSAMWHMPAWSDFTLLPSSRSADLWGDFFHVPLSGTEWLGAVLISVWVFLVVAAIAGFLVCMFLCGSTQIYLLLRREVDKTEFDEIYVEDEDYELFTADEADSASGEAPEPGPGLPVIQPEQ